MKLVTGKLLRAMKRENCVPLHIAKQYPPPSVEELELMSPEGRVRAFDDWEYLLFVKQYEEKENLKAALVRVSLCSTLKSIMSPFAPPETHYKWCVHDEWVNR